MKILLTLVFTLSTFCLFSQSKLVRGVVLEESQKGLFIPLNGAPDLKLDHVLIAVGNLKKAKNDYESLGFTVVYGGYPDKALNALIFLKDGTLIELVGQDRFPKIYSILNSLRITKILGSMKDRISSFPKIYEGFFSYALYSNGLASTYKYLKSVNISVSMPIQLSRFREDGVRVKWQLLGTKPYDLPFIIGAYTPSRLSSLEILNHSNGAVSIDTIVVSTINFNSAFEKYKLLYQQNPEIKIKDSLKYAQFQLINTTLVLQESNKITKYYKNNETETSRFVIRSTNLKYSNYIRLNHFMCIVHK